MFNQVMFDRHECSGLKAGALSFEILFDDSAEDLGRMESISTRRSWGISTVVAIAVRLAEIETNSGPIARNRVRSSFSAFFNWAITEGFLETNPVTGTGKAEEGASRDRVLTKDEIVKLWRTLVGHQHCHFLDTVHLLLLTGQRRNEIAHLRWSEVDFDARVLRLPPERVKNNREHTVHLSKPAMRILWIRHLECTRGTIAEPLVHPWNNDRTHLPDGGTHLNDSDRVFRGFSFGEEKARLDAAMKIAPYRIHDIRRTVATWLGELGFAAPHVIEAILNHVSGYRAGVAGIYQRQRYEKECRDALDKWAEWIITSFGERPSNGCATTEG
jgi:integrase